MQWMCSADCHVIEPEDVWKSRLPQSMRHRAPAYEAVSEGMMIRTVFDGVASERSFKSFTLGDGKTLPPTDVPERLKLLEADGIWAEAIIGNLAGTFVFGIEEPDFAMACARAYNDWLAEHFGPYRDREIGIGYVPICVEPKAAVAEIERMHELGLRGFAMPLWPSDPYYMEAFEPIWEAAEAFSLPISFHAHTGTYFKARVVDKALRGEKTFVQAATGTLQQREANRTATGIVDSAIQAFQAHQVAGWFVGAGILERHPDLHLVFVECGAAWMASANAHMDWAWQELPGQDRTEDTGRDDLALSWRYPLRPSEYVRRQVHATFQDEPGAVAMRHHIGIEQLLWGSDFPHPEGTWPRSVEYTNELFSSVPDNERAAITGGTFAKLYGISVPDGGPQA